ncbi:YDG domain-containing protein, partial [Betaproteobacteria bacterium]|nr:YDG domain-containing protein [Betaproteobacteria bacterium]
DALNYAGVISGTGSLTNDGGTFRLTNDNTYTGATILNSGELAIGTSGGSTGSIASQSVLFNGGDFYIRRNGDLTYSGIMSGSGSGQFRDYGNSGTLTLSGNSTRTSGTHFRGSRTIKLTHGNALGNSAFVFLLDGNSLVLSGGITTSFGNVNMLGTGATGINGALFSEAGDNVLGGGVSVRAANVTVGVDSGSTLTINGGISETVVGGLTKLDAGTLTLAGSSTITGDTTVSAGTLQIGSGGTSGSVTGNIVNNANVTFNRSDAHTYSGVISGTGTVTKLASNTLTFDGDNTYTGDTTVSAGTLQIGAGGTSGSIAGNIISNSNVTFSRSDTHIYAGVISGTGSLTNDGGFFRLTNDNTYTGSTILTSGQIQIGAPGGSTGSIASQSILFNGGNFSIRRDGDITYSGIMSGSGSFQAYGSGTLTLTGNSTRSGNNFFGGTRIIKPTHGNALGTGNVTIKDGGSLVLSGGITTSSGQLSLEGAGATGTNGALFSEAGDNVYGGSVRLVTTANVEIGVDSGSTLTINGGISESGGARSLTKSDDGTLTLAGSSTFSGGTTVSQGTLKLTNGSALGTGANTVDTGASLVLSGGITASAGQLTISGDGVGAIDGALFSEAGNNTYNGAIVLAADADFGADSGSTITFGNTINDNGGGFRFIGAGSGDFVFNGIVGGTNLFQLDIQRGNNVTFNNSVTTTDLLQVGAGAPVTGSIAVNADLTAGPAGITFNATGGSSQASGTSLISPAGLLALQGGNHSLTSSTNNVSALASIAGDVDFVNSGALQVGVPATVGMQNTGTINVSTVNGNIDIVNNISSTDTGSSAITFNAGSGSAAGTSGGGDIIVSNSSRIISGTGGRATLYTGSVAGSTVLASAIGSGSGRFRYGSDEATTNYTTALGSGNYLIYREQTTVSYTVNNVSKTYDGVTFTTGSASGASTGLVNGDLSFLSSTPFFTGSAIGATYPGSYVISVPSTTFSDLGYSAGGITNGTLTIGQKVLSVSPQFFTKTYDTNTSIPAASWSANITGLLTGDDVTITGAPVFSNANAGPNTILQGTVGITGTDSSGYSLVWSNGSGQINQAALTVTAVNDAKLIGQTDTTGYAGVMYSGFLGADGPSVFSAPITVTRTNSSINAPGSYTGVLRPSTALTTATNYTITGVNGDYDILPAGELLVRYANQTVTYGATATPSLLSAQYRDGSSNLLINLAPPVVSGNQYTFTDPFGGVAQFEVGATGATTSSSGNVSVGAYNLAATTVTQTSPNFSNNLTVVGGLTVTPSPITTSSITFSDKVYDGTTLATATSGASFAGVLTGDQVQIAGSFTFADKNVGANKSVTASGMTISGADSANYYLSAITGAGTASITPVQIDVSGLLAEDKIFDGTTAASIRDTSLITNSFFPADNVSISSIDAVFSNPAVGDKKTVTVSSINLGGSDAGNYVFNTPVQLVADIDALFIRLQGLTDINKTYDSTNQLPSGEVGYRLLSVLPEGVSLVGTPEYDSREGGLRQITQGSLQVIGISSEGYSLSWENGDGIIYGVPLQVTIHDASKTFGAEDPANYRGFSISGFVGTDTMDDLIGIPSVVRTNKEVEVPGVYADVLTLGGVRSSNYIFQYDLGDFAIGPDIQDLEIAGRTFSETQAISSTLSNLSPQNIDLIADSSVSYTDISSASGVSFENIRDQSGLSFETQRFPNIEDSGSTTEKADSKTIPGFFASIPDQLLKVFVVDGGIKLPEYSGL